MEKDQCECVGCYWSDSCDETTQCEYYTPVGDQIVNTLLEMDTKEKRYDFRKQWFEYTEENE